METVFGPDYSEAGPVFTILTAAALINAIFFWIQPLMQALDIMRARLMIYSAGIITGIISAWYFVPEYGAKGMAFAIIAMNLVMPVMFLYSAIMKLREEGKKHRTYSES